MTASAQVRQCPVCGGIIDFWEDTHCPQCESLIAQTIIVDSVTITPVRSAAEAEAIAEQMMGMSHYEATRCEYDPEAGHPAEIGHGCRNEATVSLGRGKWHLCEPCAALPAFKRFRKRERIV